MSEYCLEALKVEHPGLVGDIRFGKTQQWEVAKTVISIYVGVIAVAHLMLIDDRLPTPIMVMLSICAVIVMGFGSWLISKLSESITTARTRLHQVQEFMDPKLLAILGSTPPQEKKSLLKEQTTMMYLVFVIGFVLVVCILWKPFLP